MQLGEEVIIYRLMQTQSVIQASIKRRAMQICMV